LAGKLSEFAYRHRIREGDDGGLNGASAGYRLVASLSSLDLMSTSTWSTGLTWNVALCGSFGEEDIWLKQGGPCRRDESKKGLVWP
jgi:hypothetical protein